MVLLKLSRAESGNYLDFTLVLHATSCAKAESVHQSQIRKVRFPRLSNTEAFFFLSRFYWLLGVLSFFVICRRLFFGFGFIVLS